jgi:hypothetical protein
VTSTLLPVAPFGEVEVGLGLEFVVELELVVEFELAEPAALAPP